MLKYFILWIVFMDTSWAMMELDKKDNISPKAPSKISNECEIFEEVDAHFYKESLRKSVSLAMDVIALAHNENLTDLQRESFLLAKGKDFDEAIAETHRLAAQTGRTEDQVIFEFTQRKEALLKEAWRSEIQKAAQSTALKLFHIWGRHAWSFGKGTWEDILNEFHRSYASGQRGAEFYGNLLKKDKADTMRHIERQKNLFLEREKEDKLDVFTFQTSYLSDGVKRIEQFEKAVDHEIKVSEILSKGPLPPERFQGF